jgi:hypothetical protein
LHYLIVVVAMADDGNDDDDDEFIDLCEKSGEQRKRI